MRSAVEIRRCHAGRHLCYSLLVLDVSVLKLVRCPVDNECLRASLAKQSTACPTGDAFTSLRKPCLAPRRKSTLVGRIGVFQRDLGDGEHAEIMISESASCRPCLSSLLALGIAPI